MNDNTLLTIFAVVAVICYTCYKIAKMYIQNRYIDEDYEDYED